MAPVYMASRYCFMSTDLTVLCSRKRVLSNEVVHKHEPTSNRHVRVKTCEEHMEKILLASQSWSSVATQIRLD